MGLNDFELFWVILRRFWVVLGWFSNWGGGFLGCFEMVLGYFGLFWIVLDCFGWFWVGLGGGDPKNGAHSSSNMYIFHACALGSRLSYWAGFRNGDVIPEFVRVDACDHFHTSHHQWGSAVYTSHHQ